MLKAQHKFFVLGPKLCWAAPNPSPITTEVWCDNRAVFNIDQKKIIMDQRQYNTDVTGIYSQLLIHVQVLYLRNWSLFPFCFTLALLLSVFQYVMYCYGEEMGYI